MIGRFATIVAAAGAVALILSGDRIGATHYIWNASSSVPVGLYQLQPIDKIALLDLVAIQPPEPLARYLADGGYLPRDVLLLKRVLALTGQTVCRMTRTIAIDGVQVGEARDRDRRGRLLPSWQGCRVLGAGEFFVMNPDASDSLDGRYFGMLRTSSVVGRALPVWTEEQ
jgi:conjugative transfer signal peptidase TraF